MQEPIYNEEINLFEHLQKWQVDNVRMIAAVVNLLEQMGYKVDNGIIQAPGK